jgi:hypothetical protein
MMTYGALRFTAPIDPPIVTASVVMAPNVRRKKIARQTAKIGCLS